MKTALTVFTLILGLTFAGCNDSVYDEQADAVRERADTIAENVEDRGDEIEDRSEVVADEIEDAGERRADALEEMDD